MLQLDNFEVRSALFLHSKFPGIVASVYGLVDVWHAAVDDSVLFLLKISSNAWFFLLQWGLYEVISVCRFILVGLRGYVHILR